MNPDITIKRWLLACGAQFGIRQAHDYQWNDADSRQREMYFTYQLMDTLPTERGHEKVLKADGYDVIRTGIQKHQTGVEINLYNSQDGLRELAAVCVGYHMSPDIQKIFKDNGGAALEKVISIRNLTIKKGDDTPDTRDYHHRLICVFTESVSISLTEINNFVETITWNLETGSPQHTITRP